MGFLKLFQVFQSFDTMHKFKVVCMYNSALLYERITDTLQKQNKSAKTMCADLGIGLNTVHKLKEQAPNITTAKLYAIADYLDVSADYLLGRTDNAESHKL